MNTYMTTEELSARIKYDVRTIRQCLKDSVLFEGVHYIRPFGGRKILYIWERVEESMLHGASAHDLIMVRPETCRHFLW
ncbi:MAG: hypothetical protein ACRCT7_12045 [Shewanella sp.]